MMDTVDPRIPYQKRCEHARRILGKRYPEGYVQRVSIHNEGRRVEATVLLPGGQMLNLTVPEVEVQ